MVRRLRFSGLWYPSKTEELDGIVDVEGEGDYTAAVLPHSGLFYSAPLISAFFKHMGNDKRKVLILSPSHYYPLEADRFYAADFSLSETPYGDVRTYPFPCSADLFNDAIATEHGIEMFLPFIGKKKLSVSYALLSSISSLDNLKRMGDELISVLDSETAVIASSDFTHYGRRFGYHPYGNDALDAVIGDDLEIGTLLAEGDVEDVFAIHERTTICGIAPAMLLSYMMREKGYSGTLADHYTSYDVYPQQKDDFVSYVDVLWSGR